MLHNSFNYTFRYYCYSITFSTEPAPSVPQFFIVPTSTLVNESVGEVEVCVRSDIPVSTETLVVGETQPKDGALYQATGE